MDQELKKLLEEIFGLRIEQLKFYPCRHTPLRKEMDKRLEKILKTLIGEVKNKKLEEGTEKKLKKEEGNYFKGDPVFIGGCIKSGTTLLRNLLDYHPELVVLLNDSLVARHWMIQAKKLSKNDFYSNLAKVYTNRLFNLYENSSPDLLNGLDDDFGGYKNFLIYLKYFVNQSENLANLISSLSKAVFMVNGQFDLGHQPKFWVEKTPFNSFYFEKILTIFPSAKFIYISRNPFDNLASIKKWFQRSKKPFRLSLELRGMKKSYRITKKLVKKYPNQVLIIKYEDLVVDPKLKLNKITNFLNIKYNKSLEIPTTFGNPARPDSSHYQSDQKDQFEKGVIYKKFVNRSSEVLNDFEIFNVFRKIKKIACFFNYQLDLSKKISFWKKFIFQIRIAGGYFDSHFILLKNKIARLFSLKKKQK